MNSYQSGSAATAGLDHTFGGENVQNFQDQSTTSWPSSSSPPMALSFDVEAPQFGSFGNALQQGLGPVGDRLPSASFLCEYCPREFSKQFELNKHIRTHTKPLRCEVCHAFSAAEQKDLNRHLWSHHPLYAESHNIRRDSGKCKDCGEKYTRSDNLDRHQQKEKHGKYGTRE